MLSGSLLRVSSTKTTVLDLLLISVGIAHWAISDSDASSWNPEKSPKAYTGSTRSRSIVLSPWGAGPDPADHEFMRRLFRRWDADGTKSLNLHDLVVGFAQVKGTRDIMTNIAYFFDIYDDDGDGKVDRDGILKMSEALLFLGRKGLNMQVSSPTTPQKTAAEDGLSKNEVFLSAVSSFIRRCFEYADPDGVEGGNSTTEAEKNLDQFGIGDDDDDDLIDTNSVPGSPVRTRASRSNTLNKEVLNLPPVPGEDKPNTYKANLALDPANPLFISLPTFRMVILADETLEAFFDSGFANTFHLADQPIPAPSLTTLTTFSSLRAAAPLGAAAAATGAVLPPGKGLRGMLDSIVNDGMRVASEVRRRMEEAQRELDRASAEAAKTGGGKKDSEDDDEEDEHGGGEGDLLEGAEAAALDSSSMRAPSLLDEPVPVPAESGKANEAGTGNSTVGEAKVEFER
jgi:hypothetical protein